MSHVKLKKKGSVALSMLRVKGHNPVLSLFSPLLGIIIMATLDKARQADQVPVCGYTVSIIGVEQDWVPDKAA